jgi:HPt (histidine-containing phosphotransfer) domain-containing protein
MGGDEEGVRELIEIFLEDLPAAVADLESAGDDLVRLAKAAHSIKGSSANLAAARASSAAAAVEMAARAGDARAAYQERECLLEELRVLTTDLERARNRPTTEPS